MTLRRALFPPNQDELALQRVLSLAKQIASLVDSGKSAESEIAEFNADTSQNYRRFDFHEIEGTTSYEAFAALAAAGPAPRIPDISDDEYVEIIRRLCRCEASEAETTFWIQLLRVNLENPEISDLIYWPKREMTPAEILREARSYKPIVIPPYRDGR
jgi:hypothetical protein